MVMIPQVHNKSTLYNLCLANRAFHETFTPKLWRHLDLDHANAARLHDPVAFQALLLSPCLRHVRELTLRSGLLPDTETEFPYELNSMLHMLIQNLPNLESFRFVL